MKARALAAKPLGFAVAGAAAVAGALGGMNVLGIAFAASAKADFSLTVTPASRTVQQGQSVSYTVAEGQTNGFKDGVALTAAGLPSGASATFSPNVVDKPSSPASLTISIAANTPAGTYSSIQVVGTSGSLSHSYPISLTVTAAAVSNYQLSASPPSVTILPGDTAAYAVMLTRNGFAGSVSLSVGAGLPSNSTATFTPAAKTGSTSSLQVVTKSNTPTGLFTLSIVGTATGQPQQTTSVTLNISGTGKDFSINAAAVPALVPGGSQPVDLNITNPNSHTLTVTNLTVAIGTVTKLPQYSAGACTAADFAVTQLDSTLYPLTIPGNSSRKLSDLGIAAGQRPQVLMLNRNVNQNACVGAAYGLTFSGAAHG